MRGGTTFKKRFVSVSGLHPCEAEALYVYMEAHSTRTTDTLTGRRNRLPPPQVLMRV